MNPATGMSRLVNLLIAILASLLSSPTVSWAQAQATTPPSAPSPKATLVISPRTRVHLTLSQPVPKAAQTGDPVYLQATAPLLLEKKVAIPAGTAMQGFIVKIKRSGWITHHATVEMRFTTMTFPGGYTVTIPGGDPAVPEPKGHEGENTPGAVAAAILTLTPQGYVWVTDPWYPQPIEMVMQRPVEVDAEQAATAARLSPPPVPRPPRTSPAGCMPGTGIPGSPGMPGTPDIFIPGTPDIPPSGDFPGVPGTPPTIIPGTPPTPGTPDMPCIPQ